MSRFRETIFFYRSDDEERGFLSAGYVRPFTVSVEEFVEAICGETGLWRAAQWVRATAGLCGGLMFQSVLQFVLFSKAVWLYDRPAALTILTSESCWEQRGCLVGYRGCRIPGWSKIHSAALRLGNRCKFSQNADLKGRLEETKPCQLALASRYDKFWGIGFDVEDARENIARWGANRGGRMLEEIRDLE